MIVVFFIIPFVFSLSVNIPVPINYTLIPTVNATEWWITDEGNLDNVGDIQGSDINNDLGWITTDTNTNIIDDSLYNSSELEEQSDGSLGIIDSFIQILIEAYGYLTTETDPVFQGNITSGFSNNLFPATTLTYDLGSGANRWRWLYVQNISAEYGDFLYDVNIDGDLQIDGNLNVTNITMKNMWIVNMIATGNISTDAFFVGDGSYLTGLTGEIDTNFTTECEDGYYGDGDGNCYEFNSSVTSLLTTTYYNATQTEAVNGVVDGGTLVDTQHPDGDYDGVSFNFSEASGSPGLDIRINFTDVPDFTNGLIRYKTSSWSGDFPIIQLWDYEDNAWEDYPVVPTSESFAVITQPVYDSTDHVGGEDGTTVQMRLYKASNGNTNNHYYVDWIAITKGFGTPAGEEVDPVWEVEKIDYYNKTEVDYNMSLISDTNCTASGSCVAGGLLYSDYNNLFTTQINFSEGGDLRAGINSDGDIYAKNDLLLDDDSDIMWYNSPYGTGTKFAEITYGANSFMINPDVDNGGGGGTVDFDDADLTTDGGISVLGSISGAGITSSTSIVGTNLVASNGYLYTTSRTLKNEDLLMQRRKSKINKLLNERNVNHRIT